MILPLTLVLTLALHLALNIDTICDTTNNRIKNPSPALELPPEPVSNLIADVIITEPDHAASQETDRGSFPMPRVVSEDADERTRCLHPLELRLLDSRS